MTTFTITTEQNFTDLVGKTGTDTYNVNGGSLTINSDTRHSPNATVSTGPMGNLNGSPTLGGNITITGGNVRLIPYSDGSGKVPPSGTIIERSGITAELMCVMSSRVGGTVTPVGISLPESGWIKVRNILTPGSFPIGRMTGIAASSTSSDELGWIEVVGVEGNGISSNRLNLLTITGEWFYLGVTTGVRGQSVQLPAFDAITEYPGLEVETSVGSGVYAFWANAALKFRGDTISDDSRSRMVGITSTGLATFGTGLDLLPAGELPTAGRKIRVPNIVFSNCSPANRAINSRTASVMGTRYELNSAGSGVIYLSCITGSWYWNIAQPQAVSIENLHTCDQFVLTECSTPPVINGLHVGLSNMTVPLAGSAIAISQHYAGNTTINNISGLRAEGTITSGYAVQFTNCYGGWTINNIKGHYASNCTSVSGAVFFNACDDVTVNNVEVIGKRLLVNGCARTIINNLTYADNIKGTTLVTAACHAIEFSNNSKVAVVKGISLWPNVPNVHPYSGIVYIANTFDLTLSGVGSPQIPLDAGSINRSGYFFSDGGNNARCRFRRNWLTGLRLGISNANNTSVNIQMQNCYNTDASLPHAPNWQNSIVSGNRQNSGSVPTSYVHVTGTHFWDAFTGDTTARASIVMVEKTNYAESASAYEVNSGNPKFTAQGVLVMAAGDSITWSWNYLMLGWTGLTSFAVTGTNALTNHLFEYDIDKGQGYSGVFKVINSANLLGETGITPSGVRLKVRLSCNVSNTGNQITSFRIDGTTTLAIQNAALYPLDFATLSLSGLVAGSTVAIFPGVPVNGAEATAIIENSGATATLSYPFDESVTSYTLRARKPGFDTVELVYTNSAVVTIPLSQQENKDGFGVAIYGRGSGTANAFVSVDASALRIDIGNTRCVAEEVYNLIAQWQASVIGIRYVEALRFDGTDLLILGTWRFRRALSIHTNAGIDALPVIDGNPTGSPDDESNGSIDFRARTVRTYQINAAPAITAADLAAAVWGFAQGNGATAEANLRAARTAAENAFAVSA